MENAKDKEIEELRKIFDQRKNAYEESEAAKDGEMAKMQQEMEELKAQVNN
jgi:hypothetical protein